jgi:hypothetical protein
MNIDEIKIIRLKNGDDIIGVVNTLDNHRYNITYPMLIDIVDTQNKQAFIMTSWLAHQMFKNNDVNIWDNDILFVSDPTDLFIDHYTDTVKKLEKMIVADEIVEHLEEEMLIEEALEEKELSVIH